MGLFNIFNKKKIEVRKVDHMNDEQLKDNIKEQAIKLIQNENKDINLNTKIEIHFKYLENVEHSGLQSMFTLVIDNNTYYFSISNDNLQLLDDSAKSFFDFDDDENN